MSNSVLVTCWQCKRKRRVAASSRAARSVLNGEAKACKTCVLLASVEQHKAAIQKLYRQISERRIRGL